jgi:hypothetical protein
MYNKNETFFCMNREIEKKISSRSQGRVKGRNWFNIKLEPESHFLPNSRYLYSWKKTSIKVIIQFKVSFLAIKVSSLIQSMR